MGAAARIFAPVTAGQVEALNAFARVAHVRHASPRSGRLCTCEPVATSAGWRCACGWRQFWAWQFMAGGPSDGGAVNPCPAEAVP